MSTLQEEMPKVEEALEAEGLILFADAFSDKITTCPMSGTIVWIDIGGEISRQPYTVTADCRLTPVGDD